MAIHARCPVCGVEFRRPDSLAGKREKCPECRAVLRLPSTVLPPSSAEAGQGQQNTPAPTEVPAPTVPPVTEQPPAGVREAKSIQPSAARAQPEAAVAQPAAAAPPQPSAKKAARPSDSQPAKPSVQQKVAAVAEVQNPQPCQPQAAQAAEQPQPEQQSALPCEDAFESKIPAEPAESERTPLPSDDFFDDEIFAIAEPPLLKPASASPPLEPPESEIFDVAEPADTETGEPPRLEALDYATYAAKEIRAGQSPDAVAADLVEAGMAESEAAETVEFMSEAYQSYRPPKAAMWLKLIGGLVLLMINAPVFLLLHGAPGSPGISPIVPYAALGLAVVGLLLVLAGLWRLIRPRQLSARQLIAAWQARDPR